MSSETGIATEHPEYQKKKPLWLLMNDALEDEGHIKDKGEAYLMKTLGMTKLEDQGIDKFGIAYKAYKERARFPAITEQAVTAILGLVFDNAPMGATEDIINRAGQTNTALARECLRGVVHKGRDVLVVDAPMASEGGGMPFISTYPAESLINWKQQPGEHKPWLVVLKEQMPTQGRDEYSHETETIYRRYKKMGNGVELSKWKREKGGDMLIEDPIMLGSLQEIPVVVPGAIDLKLKPDSLPLLPVARCAFAYYRKSALLEHALFMVGQPQGWVKGVDPDQYKKILELGFGSSALWDLGEGETAGAGFLETSGQGIERIEASMANELTQAESYAVKLSQTGGGVEAAQTMRMRMKGQHATVYSMSDSVSLAMTEAQRIRAQWGGLAEPEPFRLSSDYTDETASQEIINALNSAINSQNLPRSVMFEAARKAGFTEKTNEELADEIETQMPMGDGIPEGAEPIAA